MTTLALTVKYEADLSKLPFSHLLHKDIDDSKRGHTGIHLSYEAGDWNYRQFITWLQRHIPEYALTHSELQTLTPLTQIALTTKAARLLHDRDKSIEKKGEIGELILHGLIRDVYSTEPLVSKIYYKSHPSDNVKGFDCVHIIFDPQDNAIDSLWLGEAKFYGEDVNKAIASAFQSVSEFLEAKKMQKEFLVIRNHLDDTHPAKQAAEQLLSEYTSLDEIRAKLCVPVLIAYESNATKTHNELSDAFLAEIEAEIQANIDTFLGKFVLGEDIDADVHVFFLPLRDKAKTLEIFKDHVSGYQGTKELY